MQLATSLTGRIVESVFKQLADDEQEGRCFILRHFVCPLTLQVLSALVTDTISHAKYFMIGTVTSPTKRGRPMVEGLDQLISRSPGKDAQLEKTEEILMSLYEQHKEKEDPNKDPLKLLEEEEVEKDEKEEPV